MTVECSHSSDLKPDQNEPSRAEIIYSSCFTSSICMYNNTVNNNKMSASVYRSP